MERKTTTLLTHAALIYSHSSSSRLEYIISFLHQYYGQSFKLIQDEQLFSELDHPCKINYSYHPLAEGEIWIHPHALLFETAIHPVQIHCFQHRSFPAFFQAEGTIGFDLFAAIFYLLSRYEEYLPHQKDAYGRFDYQQSLAHREGFLSRPLVNEWLEAFRGELSNRNPVFSHPHQPFSFLPTYDIDLAWSFLAKGWKRNLGGLLKCLLQFRFSDFRQRMRVLRFREADPFDCYEWLDRLHEAHGFHPVYFFLVAAHTGRYDRNVDIRNADFQSLVKELALRYAIGLHPSWASHDHHAGIQKEKKWLEQLLEQPVLYSRQHYIRFELPHTYRQLIKAGLLQDFSMGYGSINGFRASFAGSFFWFDLKTNDVTPLQVHPFCFMDANAFYEEKKSPEEALRELILYAERVKAVHGKMITVFHNNFLGTDPQFAGWKEMYVSAIDYITGSSLQ